MSSSRKRGSGHFPRCPVQAIVDVLLFLNIAREHAAVIGAGHQATEGKIPLRVLGSIVSPQNRLSFPVGVRVDEDRLRSWIRLSSPFERTHIEGVLQDEMDVSSADLLPVFEPDSFA